MEVQETFAIGFQCQTNQSRNGENLWSCMCVMQPKVVSVMFSWCLAACISDASHSPSGPSSRNRYRWTVVTSVAALPTCSSFPVCNGCFPPQCTWNHWLKLSKARTLVDTCGHPEAWLRCTAHLPKATYPRLDSHRWLVSETVLRFTTTCLGMF